MRIAAALLFVGLPAVAAAECSDDTKALIERHANAGAFRIESSFTFNGKRQTNVTEVVLPDRIRQRLIGSESIKSLLR